uniref:RHS repeat domain-containing protein n=1 Tax=Rhizobium mongolense TaxID=57676 RepID=UPI0035E4263C
MRKERCGPIPYDLNGNRLSAADPDLGNWSYAYDRANRLIRQTDARGAVTRRSALAHRRLYFPCGVR